MRLKVFASLVVAAAAACAQAQGTAFTYQGELKDSGQPANGSYDLSISIFDSSSAGSLVNGRCFNDQPVVNGRFAVELDFGTPVQGSPYYVEISARRHTAGVNCSSSTGFTTLTPRQRLTSAPYANYALRASRLVAPDGSPTNALVVDNDGKVGIGTSSPSTLVEARAIDPIIMLTDNNTGRRTQLQNAGGRFFITSEAFINGSNGAAFTMFDSVGRMCLGTFTPSSSRLEIAAQDGLGITGFQPLMTLRDANAGNARMVIQNVNGGCNILGEEFMAGRDGAALIQMSQHGRLGVGMFPNDQFRLDVNGNARCVNLVQTSSADFKNEVAPLSAGLEELMKLEPVSYVWNDKAPELNRGKHDLGFIAEDVAKILPDAVGRDESGKVVGIDYSRITVLAVKAIKDQQARHEADQAMIQSLLERLEKLEAATVR